MMDKFGSAGLHTWCVLTDHHICLTMNTFAMVFSVNIIIMKYDIQLQ